MDVGFTLDMLAAGLRRFGEGRHVDAAYALNPSQRRFISRRAGDHMYAGASVQEALVMAAIECFEGVAREVKLPSRRP